MKQGVTIGWIGTGRMGAPMVERLKAAGHTVLVYSRRGSGVRGSDEADVAELASRVSIMVTCVPGPAEVRELWMQSSGLLENMKSGSTAVDMSTIGSELAIELAEAAARVGVDFIDCPVSGGPAAAHSGSLSIMAGGAETAVAAARPVLDELGRVFYCGPAGSGQLVKMINQAILAGMMAGIGSGFALASRAGLDLDLVADILGEGVTRGYLLNAMWPRMSRGEDSGGFAVSLMRKDLGLSSAEAKSRDLDLPLLELVDAIYARVESTLGPDVGTQTIGQGMLMAANIRQRSAAILDTSGEGA